MFLDRSEMFLEKNNFRKRKQIFYKKKTNVIVINMHTHRHI